MANLTQIEDALSGRVLYQWEKRPKATRTDASWQRRSGTYTVLGQDYGINPFGTWAAPIAVRKYQWQFRVVVPVGGDLDAAAANVDRAMAKGRLHRLVRTFSAHEQVVVAQVTDCTDATTSTDNWRHRDFVVTWELTGPWRDRVSRGPHRVGDGSLPLMGSTSLVMGQGSIPLTAVSQTFTILADGSDGNQSTTVDETGGIYTIQGKFGGDLGFTLYNQTEQVQDTTGALVFPELQVNLKLLDNDILVLDSGAFSATHSRLGDVWTSIFVPDWQPYWMAIFAGRANTFLIAPNGPNPVVNPVLSQITVAWNGLYM